MNSTISHLPPQSVWIGVGLLVAAALSVALTFVQGGERRTPVGELLAVFGGCVVAGVVTSRVFWVALAPSVDAGRLWSDPWPFIDLRLGGHSSFGALVGATLVVALWLRASRSHQAHSSQRYPRRALAGLDALATGGLAGLALARLGCLANGCDFGKQATLAWSIRHPGGTDAFFAHVARGVVGHDALWSAPVHPFALYLALGTLTIVAWAVWAIAARVLSPGRVALVASGAYLVVRFCAEWTRDEATVLNFWAGFNVHHILAVVGLGALGAAWCWLGACEPEAAASSSERIS